MFSLQLGDLATARSHGELLLSRQRAIRLLITLVYRLSRYVRRDKSNAGSLAIRYWDEVGYCIKSPRLTGSLCLLFSFLMVALLRKKRFLDGWKSMGIQLTICGVLNSKLAFLFWTLCAFRVRSI